jgi:hypothetical protein
MDALSLVSKRASELDEKILARQARRYLEANESSLSSERGGVPLGLAAVMGYLASHVDPSWAWPIDSEDALRLRVGPGVKRRVSFWAGLRVVNEVAKEVYEELVGVESDGQNDEKFWETVVQAGALSTPVVVRTLGAARAARAPDLRTFLEGTPARELAELARPFTEIELVYRMLVASPKVEAAKIVHPELPTGYILKDAPDDRIARLLHRGLGAAYVLGGAGLVYHQYRNRLP